MQQPYGASEGSVSAEKALKKGKNSLSNPFITKKTNKDNDIKSKIVDELLAKLQITDKKMKNIENQIRDKEQMKFIQKDKN